MGKAEITIFLILSSVILLIFIAGIIIFVFQYRKRRINYEREKDEIEKQHKLDLLHTQLQIQQQTMQFIGQEIHDSVAQQLTLASIYTQRMEFDSNRQSGVTDKLAAISKIISDSLLELRQLSKSLTDNKMQNAGLPELVKMECERVNATGICSAGFETNDLPSINITVKSSLFRIIQEFIQNSIKHSGCRQITICLHASDRAFCVTIEDDGKGFDMNMAPAEGIGLSNIRRRVKMLKGDYILKTGIDKGVKMRITIPLDQINS
ncbi:MAG: ATP-binding protein [Ginsengibacter sp.]